MSRSERMEPIRDLAASRERDAGAAMSAARAAVEAADKQLELLRRYRDDYAQQNAPGAGSVDLVRLQNHRAFLDRLNEAVRQQEQRVEQARRQLDRMTEAWRERRVEAAALGRAVERFREDERRAADHREQRELDDLSARNSRKPLG
jgi:flagellar protein FliJ